MVPRSSSLRLKFLPHSETRLQCTASPNSFGFPDVLQAEIYQFSLDCGGSYKYIPQSEDKGLAITVALDESEQGSLQPADDAVSIFNCQERMLIFMPPCLAQCFARSLVLPTSWIFSSHVLPSLAEYLATTPLPDTVSWALKFELLGGTVSADPEGPPPDLAIQLYVYSAVSRSYRQCRDLGNGMASVIISRMEGDPGMEEGWVGKVG